MRNEGDYLISEAFIWKRHNLMWFWVVVAGDSEARYYQRDQKVLAILNISWILQAGIMTSANVYSVLQFSTSWINQYLFTMTNYTGMHSCIYLYICIHSRGSPQLIQPSLIILGPIARPGFKVANRYIGTWVKKISIYGILCW